MQAEQQSLSPLPQADVIQAGVAAAGSEQAMEQLVRVFGQEVRSATPADADDSRSQPDSQEGHPRPGRGLQVHRILARMCVLERCTFTFRGVAVDPFDVFAPEMFLPLLTAAVQESGRDLVDWDAGCRLRISPDSLFGVSSLVPHLTGHPVDLWRTLFFAHAMRKVLGVRPDANIDLTTTYEVMRESFEDLRARLQPIEGDIPWPQTQRVH